jgi:peptidase E
MQAHLFSTPGNPPIRDIVRVARPFLRGKERGIVAYLPAACLVDLYIRLTERCFSRNADVLTIDIERNSPAEIRAVLDRANVLYIPGGNTYVLAQRVHSAGLLNEIRERVMAGLPVVAFSAGTVFCGPNILTTNDMNVCASTNFAGLSLSEYSFNVHYPAHDGDERALRDDRIGEYRLFHDNPVLALEDGAHIQISDGKASVVKGNCWLFEKGNEKRLLEAGPIS